MYTYESINYQSNLPINIFAQTIERYPYHWHEDPELLFVLEGSLEIRINEKTYNLNAGDLFFINSNELHFLHSVGQSKKPHVLVLQIKSNYMKQRGINVEEQQFFLDAYHASSGEDVHVQRLKQLLAFILDLLINQKDSSILKIENLVLEILIILRENFAYSYQKSDEQLLEDNRLFEIMKYMNNHYANSSLSIEEIASEFSLSPQHLSRYFKLKAGTSLKTKLDTIRMEKSLFALQTTNKAVTEIALEFGFPDTKSYYRVFRKHMQMAPGEYRRKYQFSIDYSIPRDYLSINSRESLKKLFQYMTIKTTPGPAVQAAKENIDFSQSTRAINHSFTSLATFGDAALGLRKDFHDQLFQLQKDIGFRYVRFHNIFSDQLEVYNERPDGSWYANFSHIEALIDQLLANNIKPFIEIGFMPGGLAGKSYTIFEGRASVSAPKSMERWLELLDSFIRHLFNRYGSKEVKSWYFEFWNEPEVDYFWRESKEEFFSFYAQSSRCIKAIDPDLCVGGFGNIDFHGNASWLNDFHEFAVKQQVGLDFFSFHVYNLMTNREKKKEKPAIKVDSFSTVTEFLSEVTMIGEEDNFSASIDKIINHTKKYSTLDQEKWITEWNANSDYGDPLHDTCYMAAFIVKNAVDNFQKISGMGYWTFTDVFREFSREPTLYHGGFGLMTYNGIKKASYHAFAFLSKLGEELITIKENMIVTKSEDRLQILLWNYSHPNRLYRSFDYSQLTPTSRYGVFENSAAQSLQFELKGLQGDYRIKKHFVNQKHGSSYDAWVELGAPEVIDPELKRYLQAKAEPGLRTDYLNAENPCLLQTTLDAHEIQLIELTKDHNNWNEK
ncbi:GH39 family glycosyl hydrolase [Marinococcus luteus]|uniref:GH39 family glycosyl hydrolase n=1 Tax=Marinococcus luteus TaxID=1122204 RepID=UPI002ACC7C2C|nr:helix-turn-helix domain-containing protein [Marinococcus luteus]MDZ5781967.1 helix-turn-helix domain-containing protein [Marinococcus luteus]